ncbi:MAG: GNAT family N-acetyltransferase [Patescibacteria group bacterium]|nr:GNAT family N-acetyltransferase [Patescibacteria group bacterium]
MKNPGNSITTQRLFVLKPNVGDYIGVYESYTSDQRVTKFSTWKAHKFKKDTKAFLKTCIEKWNNGSEFNYKIILKTNKSIIGMAKLSFPEKNQVNIGYVIQFEQWNKGFATEILQGMISYSFEQLEAEKVNCTCDIENKASERVMQKAGMKFQKVLPNYVIHPNISSKPRNALKYSISRNQYLDKVKT